MNTQCMLLVEWNSQATSPLACLNVCEHAVVIQVQFTHKFSPLDKPMGTRGAGTCPRGLVRVCAGPWLRFSSKSFCSCFEHEDMELQKTETVTCISTIMSVCSLSTTDSHTNVMAPCRENPLYSHLHYLHESLQLSVQSFVFEVIKAVLQPGPDCMNDPVHGNRDSMT